MFAVSESNALAARVMDLEVALEERAELLAEAAQQAEQKLIEVGDSLSDSLLDG